MGGEGARVRGLPLYRDGSAGAGLAGEKAAGFGAGAAGRWTDANRQLMSDAPSEQGIGTQRQFFVSFCSHTHTLSLPARVEKWPSPWP